MITSIGVFGTSTMSISANSPIATPHNKIRTNGTHTPWQLPAKETRIKSIGHLVHPVCNCPEHPVLVS